MISLQWYLSVLYHSRGELEADQSTVIMQEVRRTGTMERERLGYPVSPSIDQGHEALMRKLRDL